MARKLPASIERARITSHDVARAAGVSQSAVSRAFSRAPGVSEMTRARILREAERLGYQPNALASGLITQRSGMVGVVMSQLTNPFLSEAAEHLLVELRSKGLQVLMFSAESDQHLIDAAAEFGRYRVDGCLVLSPHLSRPIATSYNRLGPTVVLFNRLVPGLDASAVTVDNEDAGARAASYLIDRGHRRLGYLHGIVDAASNRDRYAGFAGQCKKAGLPPPVEADGGFDYHQATEAARGMLDTPDRPTAVFAADDIMAMAVIDIARHTLGLDVPGDVAVVGFDDADGAGRPSYSLTTFRQPLQAMVGAGIDLLLDHGDADDWPTVTVFEAELIERGSA